MAIPLFVPIIQGATERLLAATLLALKQNNLIGISIKHTASVGSTPIWYLFI
jgi:hypothetical protein